MKKINFGIGALVIAGAVLLCTFYVGRNTVTLGHNNGLVHCPCTPDCQPGDAWCSCPEDCEN